MTGRAVAEFCHERGIPHKVFDEKGSPAEQFTEKDAGECGLIVRSPSFAMGHKWVVLALENGCRCVTELEFASCFWRGKIVAITGTNGKTTTTEFVVHALSSLGHLAVACGNVGRTFIEITDLPMNSEKAWAIVEVSSFQMDGSKNFVP
ncbi:MAG: hypothetical protein LBB18_01380, partial [Puniceicoccales bacterium]|nr:hypothetical protein [Puniceicoccales bacterium]